MGNWTTGSLPKDLVDHEPSAYPTSTSMWETAIIILGIQFSGNWSIVGLRRWWRKGTARLLCERGFKGCGNKVSQDRESMFGGYLRISMVEMLLFSLSNPPSDKVSSYKSPPPLAFVDWKGAPMASSVLLIWYRPKDL